MAAASSLLKQKYKRCIEHLRARSARTDMGAKLPIVKKQNRKSKRKYNPYAVCTSSVYGSRGLKRTFRESRRYYTRALEDEWNNSDRYRRSLILRDAGIQDRTVYWEKKFHKLPAVIKIQLFQWYNRQMGFSEHLQIVEGISALNISEARKKTWREGMAASYRCMGIKGISCDDPNYHGSLEDCEVADIGENYTWHTHPCGEVRPSPADIATTRKLHKDFLCIGVGQKGTVCYDSGTLRPVGTVR